MDPNIPCFHCGSTSLWQGDYRELLPIFAEPADLVLTDPPYGDTSLGIERDPNQFARSSEFMRREMDQGDLFRAAGGG